MERLSERDWEILLKRIKDGKCTPFLGAGVNFGILPLGSSIAEEWSKKYKYPLEDSSDLSRVAQFVAITGDDPMSPKEEILYSLVQQTREFLQKVNEEDFFSRKDEPLSVLAGLPFPIYMTTNYDSLLISALRIRKKKPVRELCQWNEWLRKNVKSVFDSVSPVEPSPQNPIVYHLHGHDEISESVVLSEDDYLDFLVNMARNDELIPKTIQACLAGTSLLFVGYRLADWSFRVLFRGIVNSMDSTLRRISVAVQLAPHEDKSKNESVQKYLDKYFGNIKIKVAWGTAKEFVTELQERWEKFENE